MKRRHFQDDWVRMQLRLPPVLREWIEISATGSGRSINAEIISRLEDSFSRDSEERGWRSTLDAADLADPDDLRFVLNELFQMNDRVNGAMMELVARLLPEPDDEGEAEQREGEGE